MGSKETMTLETAAEKYDVKLSTLRLLCLRGDIESVKVGKRRYVTNAGMDRYYKEGVKWKVKAKILPK